MEFTANTNPANGTVTFSAITTGGPAAGDSITAAPVTARPNLNCRTGLTTLTSDLALLAWS